MQREKNLKPFTKDNAAYFGRLGGIASGRARRMKREEHYKKSCHGRIAYYGSSRDVLPRQHRFIMYYMLTCNATRAAEMAGYSVRSARQYGSYLLRNPKVLKCWREIVARHYRGEPLW